MCAMKDTHMTKCGHRYCGKCIIEWVDRQHKCPCCNTGLDREQLFKDHQFDSLISMYTSASIFHLNEDFTNRQLKTAQLSTF